MDLWIIGPLLAVFIGPAAGQYVCPMEWETFEENCYKFVIYPQRTYQEALMDCAIQHASLVSINSISEHSFIKQRISDMDIRRGNWYTSGVLAPNNKFYWDGDGYVVDMTPNGGFWKDNQAMTDTEAGRYIIYAFHDIEYSWKRSEPKEKISYICEIPLNEAYKTLQDERGADYGMDFSPSLSEVESGPRFLLETRNTVIVGRPKQAYVECVAVGRPSPTYTWMNGTAGNVVIRNGIKLNTANNPRYTFTNGRLTFMNPNSDDTAKYQCQATNKIGTILGNPIQVSFGMLGEFPNVGRDAVQALSNAGAQMECPPIKFDPAIRYQWAKTTAANFVRPGFQKYIFISSNSKLYFSEVSQNDADFYYCVVTLTRPAASESYIGSGLIPSATAIKIQLVVLDNAGGQNKPEILDDFIYVSPQNPKRGETVRLECFAYGTLPLQYSWLRVGRKPMPNKVRYRDHNRVLEIPDVTEDDAGSYRCNVFSPTTTQGDTKLISLSIQSKPYFKVPLKDQFVNKGSQLTWRCYATATPPETYHWFKDGQAIQTIPGEMEVRRNTLLILNLSDNHNGMYQCAANNEYGTVFSSAQLTVLEFAPSFKKQPVPGTYYGTLRGNTTLKCMPEAAPFPTFRWYRNGGDLGVTLGDTTSRIRLLPGGDLLISEVQYSDQGEYRCEAENPLGKDSISGQLAILQSTVITQAPDPRTVLINDTAFMYCRASFSPELDMIYIWRFNGMPIDVQSNPYYSWGSGYDSGGLYIRNAQFEHEGEYTCVARTQGDEVTASAYLTVNGPPGQPAGVYAVRTSVSTRGIRIKWTPGEDNGAPIDYYIVEGATNFEDFKVWRVLKSNIYAAETVDTTEPLQRTTVLTTLTPGTGYKFRVRAQNRYGLGLYSPPSGVYQTDGDKPTQVVEEVGGGGGKVGDLVMTWKPLDPVDHHGDGIGYGVYWRRKGPRVTDIDWEKARILGNVSRYVHTVGQAYFYTEYEVKVQAFNSLGSGPNSSIQVIYSAEDLPIGTPLKVYGEGFNSTCLKIYWRAVPDTREQMKGRLLGYKINYWIKGVEIEVEARQAILHGQRDNGLIIGLDPDTFYYFNAQTYNTAGNGPKSDTYEQTTFNLPPQHYPVNVRVNSVDESTVEVNWRGVSTDHGEEPLQGYKMRYWVYGTDIRNATDVDTGRRTQGFVRGLQKNTLYNLRVLSYSRGGDGKMSMPALAFSMENSQIRYDPGQTDLLAGSSSLYPSVLSLICVLLYVMYFNS